MNTRFEYFYRDGSNYKRWGSIVFRGACDLVMRERLLATLTTDGLFVAHQVRLPELFFEDALYADDHCFHELAEVNATEEPVDDRFNRTILDFVAEMERVSKDGWSAFDRWARRFA